ncbi:hypothetical protein WN66_02657 [Saccharomyces cerevisiae]|nr:hypothetical protein WN66_02657 [Saccharomyces cerevisiae]
MYMIVVKYLYVLCSSFFDCILNFNETVFGPSHRAFNPNNIIFIVDFQNFNILDSNMLVSHMTRHLSSWQYPTWVLVLTIRTTVSMHNRCTMRCSQTLESIPFHHTGKTFAFTD